MKVTNTEHTAINGNQSKCRMTQLNLGGALTKSGNIQVGGFSDSFFLPLLLSRIGLAISVSVLPISDAVHCNPSCSALHPPLQCTASLAGMHRGVLSSAAVSSRMRGGRREHQEEK